MKDNQTKWRHHLTRTLLLACLSLLATDLSAQTKVLFDASHRENAGNADWIIDADTFDLNQAHYPCGGGDFENESNAQRFPTPPASGITAMTPESYWTGGISAFGVDLVKIGYEVESLPVGASITYGDAGNPQDLSNYAVFVLPEPNLPFDTAETTAIRDFVVAGGGLFLITDHQTSDRDCDGFDSPHIGNDLMGVTISGGAITDFGLFGIVFNVSEIAGQSNADYWFTDGVDDNVSTDPSDPIIAGPHGSGSGGLGFFGATAMTIDPTTNATVRGHVWKSDAGSQGTSLVTFATASHGAGRIACIGDSSPADDGTGDPGDNLYLGWDQATGGVNNKEIHLNAIAWLAGPDLIAPTILTPPTVTPFDCSATLQWSTDEAADSRVEYGPDSGYGSSSVDGTLTTQHDVDLSGLSPNATYHYRVGSADGSGNGPTWTADATFSTGSASAPTILSGPTVTMIGGSAATIRWTTDEAADSVVRYGLSAAYTDSVSSIALVREHELVVSGLTESTLYHFSVESSDGCLNGPVVSADDSFSTSVAQVDLSGWTLQQFNSTQSFVFPPGTTLPANGYLVLARDANQAAFESEWGPLPSGTTFVNSGDIFPFINGGESFQLIDAGSALIDGVTISMGSATSIQRNQPSDPAGLTASWTVTGSGAGSPGSGAGLGSAAGVIINEASDASSFSNEFIELYNDSGIAAPDTTAPSAIVDLIATPLSDSAIKLQWSAPGDDGAIGTATQYIIRRAPYPILTESDFVAATPVGGAPSPQPAGAAESFSVAALTEETAYFFAVRALDESDNASPLSNSSGATTAAAGGGTGDSIADHLVISEIQTHSGSGSDDEFVELHNPTNDSISTAGWSLQYKSATGTTYLVHTLSAGSIPSGGYWLITRPAGDYNGAVTGDETQSTFLMSASGGNVFLADNASGLSSCADANIVDAIGYGSGNCPEGSAANSHGAGESLERLPAETSPLCGNGSDTDDNNFDFVTNSNPDPQNSSSNELSCRSLGDVGSSLFLGVTSKNSLLWGSALNAATYRVRQGSSADALSLLLETATTTAIDNALPSAGETYFYSAVAVSADGDESSN